MTSAVTGVVMEEERMVAIVTRRGVMVTSQCEVRRVTAAQERRGEERSLSPSSATSYTEETGHR